MGIFKDKKDELIKANENGKKTFNADQFNQLGTALLNDVNYVDTTVKEKEGKLTNVETQPIRELRKSLIGGVAKAAGCDSAEQAKMVDEYQFPKLPLYPWVSTSLEGYMETGKAFAFEPRANMKAKISMEPQAKVVKDVKAPGETDSRKKEYGAFNKVKASSPCPKHLTKNL
jgi:hypothetical protein